MNLDKTRRYSYYWTFYIPLFGLIRFFYIGFKYKFTDDSFPSKIHPIWYPFYQIFIINIILYLVILQVQLKMFI